MTASSPARSSPEFIALMALTFSLISMSIDGMLPALGEIAADLGVGDPNDRQLVLATFFAGLSVGQFIYGLPALPWPRCWQPNGPREAARHGR